MSHTGRGANIHQKKTIELWKGSSQHQTFKCRGVIGAINNFISIFHKTHIKMSCVFTWSQEIIKTHLLFMLETGAFFFLGCLFVIYSAQKSCCVLIIKCDIKHSWLEVTDRICLSSADSAMVHEFTFTYN